MIYRKLINDYNDVVSKISIHFEKYSFLTQYILIHLFYFCCRDDVQRRISRTVFARDNSRPQLVGDNPGCSNSECVCSHLHHLHLPCVLLSKIRKTSVALLMTFSNHSFGLLPWIAYLQASADRLQFSSYPKRAVH